MEIGDVTFFLLAFTIVSGNIIVAIRSRTHNDKTEIGFAIPGRDTIFLGATTVKRATEDAQDFVNVWDQVEREI